MSFLGNPNKKLPPMSPADVKQMSAKDAVSLSRAIASGSRLRDVLDGAEELYATPLSAGVIYGYPGSMTDEEWMSGATRLTKKYGLSRYFLRMLSTMRHTLKGKPYRALPLPTEPCICKSTKKYGECCGIGAEDTDPAECKAGNHQFHGWEPTDKGRLIKGCWNCMKVEEAPWAADTEINGLRAVLIGCRHCGAQPSIDDAQRAIKEAEQYDQCAFCGLPVGFKSVHIEHKYAENTHFPEWIVTQAEWNPLIDFAADIFGNGELSNFNFTIHKECGPKAFPKWDALKNSGMTQSRQKQHKMLKDAIVAMGHLTKKDPE